MSVITQTIGSGYYLAFSVETNFGDIITVSLLLLLAGLLGLDLIFRSADRLKRRVKR